MDDSTQGKEMRFRLSEANYGGVCIIQLKGYWTNGTASIAFMKLFDRRVNESNRYFVFDMSEVSSIDSTTLGNIASVPARLSLRVSELAIIYPCAGRAIDIFRISGFIRAFPSVYATLGEALSKMLCQPVESIEPFLKFEERLSIDTDGVVRDYSELLERSLRKIHIFLASSEELRRDRDEFEIYFRQLNDELLKQNRYLLIHRWENYLDAMSETRLQDEYNKAIRECDIFVSLFSTKTGKFTEEEFATAHQWFKKTGKPLIYTFFKDTTINTNDIYEDDLLSLFKFKQRLKDLGHFYTSFASTDDLKLRFRNQLDKLLDGKLKR
jgi:anti-anti-sigma regulatory factor